MNTEHYFVVRYTEGEGWSWDTDTTPLLFDSSRTLAAIKVWVGRVIRFLMLK